MGLMKFTGPLTSLVTEKTFVAESSERQTSAQTII